MSAPSHKECAKCNELLVISGFSKDTSKKDGLQSWCKQCRRHRYLARRKEEINRAYEWAKKNPERRRDLNRASVARHPESRAKWNRTYYQKNSEYTVQMQEARRAEQNALTHQMKTKFRQTWSADEISFLMADNGLTIYQKAVALGRTHSACRGQLRRLRNNQGTPA